MAGETPPLDVDEPIRLAVRVTEYWSNVDQSAGPDACWPWTGYEEDGYGRFHFDGRMVGAHELAVTFTTGERRLPELDTCHGCGNPTCCNPRHLRFDTRLSNVADTVRMGRNHRPGLRLTDEQVVEMRHRRKAGAPLAALAQNYSVSEGLVSMITSGQRRSDLGGPITLPRKYVRKAG